MHPDVVKLLDLQTKDAALDDVGARLEALDAEVAVLDRGVARAAEAVDAARRALAEGHRRRTELETKIESHRVLQERRQQRLETVRNPKEASALMAELDLARSVMAKEEADWVRAADAITQLEHQVAEEQKTLAALGESQLPARGALEVRRQELLDERQAVTGDREASAARIDKTLRIRYDRLRRSRAASVVVPLRGGTCSACNTMVPLSRRTQIKAGTVIDGCEACGAILYAADGATPA